LEEVMNFKDFCQEKGLNGLSQESHTQYQIYITEMERKNRPYLDDIRKKAEEVKKNLCQKK